jgi:hypothetical protein
MFHWHSPFLLQKLKAHIEKDPYPSRSTKESLAQELGLTLHQVQTTAFLPPTMHFFAALNLNVKLCSC